MTLCNWMATVYDYQLTNSEGCVFNKLVFYSWCAYSSCPADCAVNTVTPCVLVTSYGAGARMPLDAVLSHCACSPCEHLRCRGCSALH